MVELAAGASKVNDLSLLSRAVCQELAAAVGDTVNVAIHDGHDVISIDQAIGAAAITSIDWVGRRTPMHATGAGKLFMAHMPPARSRRSSRAGWRSTHRTRSSTRRPSRRR